MKNIIKPIIALFALFVVSCSVEDIQDRPVIVAGDAPVLTAPTDGATYVLLPENAEKQVERFTWKSSNYGGAVEVTYAVQVDLKDAKFANAKTIGSAVSQNQVSVTQAVLNTAALTLGATPFSPVEMEVRVQSTLGTTSPLFSNVIAIVVTPYTTEAPKLYVPGSYAEASGYPKNWDPATSPQLAASGYGKVDFEGYIYISSPQAAPNDGLKFASKNNWDGPNFGDDGTNSGKLSETGGNVGIANSGYYKVNVNTTAKTYSLTATSWAIIGNATSGGWDNETPMTYNPTTKKWTVIATLTTQAAPDNGLKFRANNGWDLNLGDDNNDGVLEYSGKNIGTTAGTYTIELDLSNPRNYKYTLTKN